MEEILKCPFCGGKSKVIGRQKFKVICKECGASSIKFDFKSDAIGNWNKRVILNDKAKEL